jgi:ankyrin repeat protein
MSKTALIKATRDLDFPKMKQLLAAKPELISVRDQQGRNLLELACCVEPTKVGVTEAEQVKIANYLLDLGIEIDDQFGKDKVTALFCSVARAKNRRLTAHLIKRGAKVSNAPGGGLYAAAWFNDVKHLELLLDNGADIETVVGVTPFFAAWSWKQFDAAKYLVKRGADIDAQDRKGRTALHWSIEKEDDPALLRWLLDHGASPDIHDRDGVSSKERASRKRDKRFIAAFNGSARKRSS